MASSSFLIIVIISMLLALLVLSGPIHKGVPFRNTDSPLAEGRRPSIGIGMSYGSDTYGYYSDGALAVRAATRSASLRAATAAAATTASYSATTSQATTTNSEALTTALAAYAATTAAASTTVDAATTASVAAAAAAATAAAATTSTVSEVTSTSATTSDSTTATTSTTTSTTTTSATLISVADTTGGLFTDTRAIRSFSALSAATTRSASTTRTAAAMRSAASLLSATTAATFGRGISDSASLNIAAITSTTARAAASTASVAATVASTTAAAHVTTTATATTVATDSSSSGAGTGDSGPTVSGPAAVTTASSSSSSSNGPAPSTPPDGDAFTILYFGPLVGRSSFFLQNMNSNITLVVRVAPTSRFSRVEISLNGKRLGYASGRVPQFSITVPIWMYDPSDVLLATPYDRSGLAYQSAEYRPQFIRIPRWLLSKTRLTGDNNGWSYSGTNIYWSIGPSSFDASSLEVIGFRATFSGYIRVNISVTSLGVCLFTTSGSMTISLAASRTATAVVPVNVQTTFGLVPAADQVFEPTLGGLSISIAGKSKVSTPWGYDWTIGIGPLRFGVEAAITAVPAPDVFLPYRPSEDGNAFSGLPIILGARAARVNLPIALDIAAALDMGSDIFLTSNGSIVPSATWTGSGFKFESASIDCALTLTMDVWIQRFKVNLIDINTVLQFSAKKRELRDTPIQISPNGTLIRNRWAPQAVINSGVFRVFNVYPSSSLQVASSSKQDMAIWTSFVPNAPQSSAMQIQWTVRTRGASQWSNTLNFIPGSGDKPLVQPELATLGENFVLIAAQITRPREDITGQQPRLVYSLWDGNAWSNVQPLFPYDGDDRIGRGDDDDDGPGKDDDDGGGGSRQFDYLPTLARGGSFVAFRRVQRTGEQSLYAFSYADSLSFRPPSVVVEDAVDIRDVSIDSDGSTTAMLAFQYRGSPLLQICFFNSATWNCTETTSTVGAFSKATVIYDGQESYCIAYADPSDFIRADYYSARTGLLTSSARLSLPYTPWDMNGVVTAIAGSSIVLGWQAPLADGIFFDYALASPGRLLYSPVLRMPLSEEIAGTRAVPLAITMSYTGNTILFTSMLRTRLRPATEGQFTLRDLPVSADLSVMAVTFDPPNFSRNDITVNVTLQNLGLEPFYAEPGGEITLLVYNPTTRDLKEVTHAAQPASLDSGQTYSVSFPWLPAVDTPNGGVVLMDAQTPTPDVNATNNVLAVDPCVFFVNRIKVVTSQGESAITVRLQVFGWLAGRVRLEAYSRPANSPNSTTSFIGSTGVTVTPGYANTVRIPITNPSLLASYIRVDVRGPSDSFTSVDAVLPDLRYDFSFDELHVSVTTQASGSVVVVIPVLNRGSAYARSVLVQAFLDNTAGSLLATSYVDLGPYDNQTVQLSFTVSYALSNVMFVINGDNKFPETFSFDNTALRTIYISSLPVGPGPGAGGGGSGTGGAGGVADGDSYASSAGLPPAFAAAGNRASSSSTTSRSNSGGDSLSTPAIIGITIGCVVAGLAVAAIAFLAWKQHTSPYTRMEDEK